MLEELCRSAMYHICREAEETAPLVVLKGQPWKKVNEFTDFFTRTSSFIFWPGALAEKAHRSHRGSDIRKSWVWMNEHADALCMAYIAEKGGDLQAVMRRAETFDALFQDFKTYFAERRQKFMEKTEASLAERNAELAKIGKTPQSHGGVANLLKVLTKTMHTQGSSIYSIAKVQYAICIQAGIYIPDEFLTDVLVAQEIMNGEEGTT